MSGLVSAIVEAWQELRINKTRILLALIGVALSVAALTSVVGMGNLVREGYKATSERSGGRTATLGVGVYGQTMPDPEKLSQAYLGIGERYGITYSTNVSQTQHDFQFPRGVQSAQVQVVDPDYGVIHRVDLSQGSWFADTDGKRFAPALVVSEAFYTAAGRPNLTTRPPVTLAGPQKTTAVIIGVVPDLYPQMPPSAYMLTDAAARAGVVSMGGPSQFEIWVQDTQADSLKAAIAADLRDISRAWRPTWSAGTMPAMAIRSRWSSWGWRALPDW